VGTTFAIVQASNFPARAGALAEEIRRARADLVGLQEVSLWRTQCPSDPTTPATTVAYDFLQLLLDSLRARGLHYTAVSTSQNFEAEIAGFTPPATLCDIRFTDRDVIIARNGIATSNPLNGHFAARVIYPILGGAITLPAPRGWTSVDVTKDGKKFRFFNTHLEVATFAPIQLAQATEALALLAASPFPVIAVGDYNTDALGRTTPTYGLLTGPGGLTDVWAQVDPGEPSFTEGQPETIDSPTWTGLHRIDYIFSKGLPGAVWARTFGTDPSERLPSGLWPSDHAGVAATVVLDYAIAQLQVYPRHLFPGSPLQGDRLHLRFTAPPSTGPWTVRIDWGNGEVTTTTVRITQVVFLHQTLYPAPGTYPIHVTVTDAFGNEIERSTSIVVPGGVATASR
jgi:endonuclease/exonuclease/phosphatase family metal-dependent hydrolase